MGVKASLGPHMSVAIVAQSVFEKLDSKQIVRCNLQAPNTRGQAAATPATPEYASPHPDNGAALCHGAHDLGVTVVSAHGATPQRPSPRRPPPAALAGDSRRSCSLAAAGQCTPDSGKERQAAVAAAKRWFTERRVAKWRVLHCIRVVAAAADEGDAGSEWRHLERQAAGAAAKLVLRAAVVLEE